MDRAYLDWLQSLPNNSRPVRVNEWMGGWAPLDTEIDPAYEALQQKWNQRDCPDGVMSRLWRWLRD